MIAVSYQEQPQRDHRGYFKGYAEWNRLQKASKLSNDADVYSWSHEESFEERLRRMMYKAQYDCLSSEGPSYLCVCIPEGVIPNEIVRPEFRQIGSTWMGGYEEFKVTPPKTDNNGAT
jgi:hypothetical protein